MLYHVSPVHGIAILEPRVSTHGKAWVYAVENRTTGLLFGARHDDFDLILSNTAEGTPVVYECYPDAWEQVYQGKSCSLYTVKEEGFLRGMTGWSPELVCEHAVPVEHETVIEDLALELEKERMAGRLIFHRYEHTAEYKRRIANQVVDRLIRFGVLENDIHDERLTTHYGKIIEALQSARDGHLLD